MASSIQQEAKLTETADRKGVDVIVCDPGWFDKRETFKIANSPTRTASLEFSGTDLNFVARVLYAESSGSAQVMDKEERLREKEAILNVKHFRLNRQGYPNRSAAKTFTEVCEAPGQFESVYATSPKFSNSASDKFESLRKHECQDMTEAIDAVRSFIARGPNSKMVYDNFRGGKGSRGVTVGLSRFWLSDVGKKLHEKNE